MIVGTAWTTLTEPTEEPVSISEAKAHCRVDSDDENLYVESLIRAARFFLEEQTRQAFVYQTIQFSRDSFPVSRGLLELPRPPLVSVTSLDYLDTGGNPQTLASSKYLVDSRSFPGRIQPAWGEVWPDTRQMLNAVTVTYLAGYGATGLSLPQKIRQAVLLLVAHWFEQRQPTEIGHIVSDVPLSVESLVSMIRNT